jgi:hypothetical protein
LKNTMMRLLTDTLLAALACGISLLIPMTAATARADAPQCPARLADFDRATHAFKFYYQFAPAGWRHWSQQDAQTWTERYDAGEVTTFYVVGRTCVAGDWGAVVVRSDGGLEVFIPDRGSRMTWARFRTPGGDWQFLGQMEYDGSAF